MVSLKVEEGHFIHKELRGDGVFAGQPLLALQMVVFYNSSISVTALWPDVVSSSPPPFNPDLAAGRFISLSPGYCCELRGVLSG